MMKFDKKSSYGFTLIEIQIALLLLVLIMGILFGALHLASKSWKIGQVQNEMIEEQRLVVEFMRKQFSQIMPILWITSRGSDLIFRGNEDSLLYVSILPANRLSGLPSLLQLRKINNKLEFGYRLLTPDKTPFDTRERMDKTQVIDRIEKIKFEYFGKKNKGSKPPEWYSTWESKRKLPRLIKCQITFADGNKWPEMIFPLHIDDPTGYRQFFLEESRSYEFDQGGQSRDPNSREGSGPTLSEDEIENLEDTGGPGGGLF
ncbi:MAG: hypothetical protein AB8D52_10180 [Gammaproteobacteria bacterium]